MATCVLAHYVYGVECHSCDLRPLPPSPKNVITPLWINFQSIETFSMHITTTKTHRLVLGQVTTSGIQLHCSGKSISVYNQPPRSTQPGHPSVGMCNEYQAKGSDALQLGSKRRYGLCVGVTCNHVWNKTETKLFCFSFILDVTTV